MASDEKRSALMVELEQLATQWEKSAHNMAYWAGMSDANDASKDRGVAGAQMDCASQLRRLLRRHPADEASSLRAENAAIAKYACHRGNCIYYGPHPVVTAERPCSCGLSALLRKDGERG